MEHHRRRTAPAPVRLTAAMAVAVVLAAAAWLGGTPAFASEVISTTPPTEAEGPCGPNPCAPSVEGPCGANPCAPPVEGGPCPVDVCHSGPIEGPCGPNPCAPPTSTCPNDVCPPPPGGGVPPGDEVPPGPPPPADDTEPPLGPPPPAPDVDPPEASPPIWNDGSGQAGPILDGPTGTAPGHPSVERTRRLRDAVARIGRLARLGGSPPALRLHEARALSPTRGR
jgi:hypothetical protein